MEQDLRTLPDALSVIRRRWVTVATFVVLGVLAGVALSLLQTPQYSATSSVILRSPVSQLTGGRALDAEEVTAQAEIVVSDAVAMQVIDDLDLADTPDDLAERVVAEPFPERQVIEVTATALTAEDAADVANAFATTYITVGQERALEAQARVNSYYAEQLSRTRNRIQDVRARLAVAPSNELLGLQSQIDALTGRLTQLQTSLLTVNDPTRLLPQAEELNDAEPPADPAQPDAFRSGLLGGVIGLVLGLLVAFLRERTDDVVRDGGQAESLLNAPVLGHVPRFDPGSQGRVVSLVSPFSPVAEAYRVLNANVRFLLAAHAHGGAARRGPHLTPAGAVMIASAAPGEGKTSLATNLAVTAARAGNRVVLVEADLRNPGISRLFGLDAPRGLSDLLIEGGTTADYLLDVGVDNLLVLPAGSIPPNPAELLASPQAHELWNELRSLADLVILDTPPLLRVADGLEVAPHVDAVVVTARYATTRKHELEAISRRLTQIGGERSVGVVLNAEPSSKQSHVYGYGQRPTVGV